MALPAFSNFGRRLLQSLYKNTSTAVTYQQQRNIVKLRRRFPPQIPNLGGRPHRFKPRHSVFVWEGDSQHEPQTKLRVILTEDVPKIGIRGELVSVSKNIGRNKLLAKHQAVYASPENLKEFARERKEREEKGGADVLTMTALKTIDFLKKSRLQVKIRATPEWDILPKEAVIHAFNKQLGVVVPDHALELPAEPITDYGSYTVNVTINRIETVPVAMDVEEYINKARSKRQRRAAKEA